MIWRHAFHAGRVEFEASSSPRRAAPSPSFRGYVLPIIAIIFRAIEPRTLSRYTDVQLVDHISDAIAINGWKSIQFVYTYNLFGFAYRRAITFLKLPEGEQLVIEVTAGTDDFKKAYARGYRVINSIYFLPLVFEPGPI